MATAGHDLRQPLQIIGASIELAKRQPDRQRQIRHLDNALKAVDRLGSDLSLLAQAAADDPAKTAPIAWVRFLMSDLFVNLGSVWHQQAAIKGIRLRIIPTTVFVRSDRRLLTSILGNLVGNAIKYTPRAGNGGLPPPGGLPDRGLRDRHRDRISEADQATIFAPFKQIDSSSDGWDWDWLW